MKISVQSQCALTLNWLNKLDNLISINKNKVEPSLESLSEFSALNNEDF